MSLDTTDLRNKARRVKNHILSKYLKLADRVDEKGEGDLTEAENRKYWEMTKEFAKNVVPRSQEVTGEDGQAIKLTFDSSFNGTLPETEINQSESSEIQDSESGA